METIHLYNLGNLCRVCLSKTDIMSNLFDPSSGLFDLFRKITNIELERNEAFPNYLCSGCQDKLLICHDFMKQCKKTDDLLQGYKQRNFELEDDSKIGLGSVPITEIVEFISHDEDSDDTKSLTAQKRARNTTKLRLKQFSHDEVIQAIENLKRKFNNARKCVKCSFEGRNSRALSVHMSFIHKELKDKWCGMCNVIFDDLKNHSGIHEVELNNCQFCGRNLTSRAHLIEHIMSHTVETRPYKCDVCTKTFISARHLRIHVRTHTREKLFVCNLCGSSFAQSHSLKVHLEKLHSLSAKNCVECKVFFRDKEEFLNHKCGENQFVEDSIQFVNSNIVKQNYCRLCSKNVRSLTVHNKNIHEGNPELENPASQLCTVCGKQFKNNSKLRIHMRIHTGETPYSCSYCDKKMSTRNHLVVHERTHTGERPHICNICNKAFSQTSILNTHMKLHTGRPEICMVCSKRFCRPAELKLHMRKHTGEKPFVCSYCGKSFIQKSHLVEHTRSHTDEKPFKCLHCEKSFRQRSSLKTHVQIHLGQKPFKCTQCSYACRQSYSLTIHMRQHSSNAP